MNSGGWLSLSVRLSVALAIGLAAGLMFGAPWAGVAAVLAIALALQLFNLLRVLRWLQADQTQLAPEQPGPWGHLIAMIVRLYRRRQFHKQRLLRLQREVGRSPAALPQRLV